MPPDHSPIPTRSPRSCETAEPPPFSPEGSPSAPPRSPTPRDGLLEHNPNLSRAGVELDQTRPDFGAFPAEPNIPLGGRSHPPSVPFRALDPPAIKPFRLFSPNPCPPRSRWPPTRSPTLSLHSAKFARWVAPPSNPAGSPSRPPPPPEPATNLGAVHTLGSPQKEQTPQKQRSRLPEFSNASAPKVKKPAPLLPPQPHPPKSTHSLPTPLLVPCQVEPPPPLGKAAVSSANSFSSKPTYPVSQYPQPSKTPLITHCPTTTCLGS